MLQLLLQLLLHPQLLHCTIADSAAPTAADADDVDGDGDAEDAILLISVAKHAAAAAVVDLLAVNNDDLNKKHFKVSH